MIMIIFMLSGIIKQGLISIFVTDDTYPAGNQPLLISKGQLCIYKGGRLFLRMSIIIFMWFGMENIVGHRRLTKFDIALVPQVGVMLKS